MGKRAIFNAWVALRSEGEEYRELDDERVFVLDRLSGHGKISGLEIGQAKTATLFHVRYGKVTRLVLHWDRDRALADLGVLPEGNLNRNV